MKRLSLALLLSFLTCAAEAQNYGLPVGPQQFSVGSPVYITPTLQPVSTAAAAATLVLKASAGQLFSITATNLTATAGVVMVQNSATAATSGAVVPILCVPLPASGSANINFSPGPPAAFTTGISVTLSSPATSCTTATTGTITGFISGMVQ